ncbi:carboxypeptidase-like regulatory domain-containing protein [Flavobacterium silvaticum]|uniref:Carboxypeptidase regulatory-like domain-containing protein n=1 Tax=Flavobacterium silvaticum TaxID=1852020 RepID=A0A972JGB4_9FLAO|nr:carboxypeptidase-like regulatory domain-containing protein [Flavobacterium silvaticum]NMH28874.1 hypothetical protein [Flavobacterium silvaticum]
MKKILLLIAASSLLFSCDPVDDGSSSSGQSDTTFRQNFGPSVSRDFIGQVVDASNSPIVSATVKIGSTSVQTDVNGVFIINGASVNEKFAYVTATKAGYIDGSRSLVPTSGKNNVKIMLIESGSLQTVHSGEASEVSIYSGTKVNFDGSFEDENGIAYSGDVAVSLFHLTPSNPDVSSLMPGMLYAETATGSEAVLQTFGMINVELRGSAGQKLQIAEGHTAQITLRIDDDQLANAPATIPLWHFDEEAGWWKEDGQAAKQGNYYVGNVGHFSWWNCDAPFPTIALTVTIQDATGQPVANAGVKIQSALGNSEIGTTNENGQISGQVPSNMQLMIELFSPCGNVVSTMQINSLTSDTILPPMIMSASTTTIVQGSLLQCDGNPITNGYLIYGNDVIPSTTVPVTNGSFSFSIPTCSEDSVITVFAYDANNQKSTGNILYTIQSIPITNLGSIPVCSSDSEYWSYQIDDGPVILNPGGEFSLLYSNNVVHYFSFGFSNAQQTGFEIYSPEATVGTYTTADNFNITGESNGITVNASTPNTLLFVISSALLGGYVDLTINGTFQDSQGVWHTLNVTAHRWLY